MECDGRAEDKPKDLRIAEMDAQGDTVRMVRVVEYGDRPDDDAL